jgi:sarcosine oxidase subunit gamma
MEIVSMADASSQIRLPGRNALSGRAAVTHANQDGGKPGLVIEELVHLGKLNIRGTADILPGITAQTGCQSLPETNQFVTIGERHLAWLGPDEYLLLCDAGREDEIQTRLRLDFEGIHTAVTNVTDSLCALNIRGNAVRKVLAKGCALDLHEDVFVAGQCAQSLLSLAGVTLLATGDTRFTLVCRTSFAPYVVDWLVDAALEYGVSYRA